MKNHLLAGILFGIGAMPAGAVLTTFSYSQASSVSGAGSVAPFSFDDGGGPILFTATPMPAATVVNPLAGAVGRMGAAAGNSNEPDAAVGLVWSGSITATGTRGASTFLIDIPLKFVPKITQVPDVSDYNWNLSFGDGQTDVTGAGFRFAMWYSRDTVIDATETAATFQRYTQQTFTFAAGTDTLANTDLTNTTIKDASDGGAPLGTDAEGRDLAFYYGWRDGGALPVGTFMQVNTFAVGGTLNADQATLRLVPEPSVGLLALCAAGLGLRRRRQAAR